MSKYLFWNPNVQPRLDLSPPDRTPLEFHRRLPGYKPSPLRETPELAEVLGVGQLWIKDESSRLEMPSFKILGASWAVYQALRAHTGAELEPWDSLEGLRAHLDPFRPLTLVAATDGNHGRAVARMAALLGLGARIFAPSDMVPARIKAIEEEGAEVLVVNGSYDEAVARSAEEADERHLVISDTAWPGYETTPRQVIEGYSTIFWEIEDQLAEQGAAPPDVVLVQIGVGALAAAVVRHYRAPQAAATRIVGIEPTGAPCVLASMQLNKISTLPFKPATIMAGLNCGTPSPVAWPILSQGIDLFLAIDDEYARQAMRSLLGAGIVAGETGAASVGGLIRLLNDDMTEVRQCLGLDHNTRVLLLSTEGATDPVMYEQIVQGHPL